VSSKEYGCVGGVFVCGYEKRPTDKLELRGMSHPAVWQRRKRQPRRSWGRGVPAAVFTAGTGHFGWWET